jgi:Mu-like prophage major head subunit gpT
MPINLTDISNLTRPGLAAVFGDYDTYPDEWKEIFQTYESDKAQEVEVEMKLLGPAMPKQDGGPVAVDSMGQRFTTTYVHSYFGLSFAITRQAIKDNLYQTKFPLMVRSLKKSMQQTKNIMGASILNNGFSGNYPIGDGEALFSAAHPIDGGTVSNLGTAAALLETSLELALIQIQQFKDQAGLLCQTNPTKLIVPPALQFTAKRILGSSYRTETTNNDINAIYNTDAVPQGYRTNHYLTSSTAWFVLTDADNGLKHYVREPLETDVYADFMTDNLLHKAIERYSFGVSNFRSIYGNAGV